MAVVILKKPSVEKGITVEAGYELCLDQDTVFPKKALVKMKPYSSVKVTEQAKPFKITNIKILEEVCPEDSEEFFPKITYSTINLANRNEALTPERKVTSGLFEKFPAIKLIKGSFTLGEVGIQFYIENDDVPLTGE